MSVRSILGGGAAACLLLASGCGGSGSHGNDIVFVSTRDGDYALYGMSADGSDQGRLTEEHGDTSSPAGTTFQIDPDFSPDGTRIAFASARTGSLDVYVMDADGSNTRRLTTAGDNQSQPSWSPDGRWIAYSRRLPGTEIRELWVVHPDGSGRRRLTARAEAAYGPAWSPDGKTIAFASKQETGRFEIFAIGVDGKGFRRVTFSTEDAFEPAWSPDGQTIAFSRGGSLVSVDPSGGHPTVLTGSDTNDSSPDWNPRPDEGEEQS